MTLIIATVANDQEREAITWIFERHYARMKSIAMSILHNELDAEDAAMNAITQICKQPELFLDYKSPKTASLVFLSARHEAIDLYRKNERRRAHVVLLDEETTFFEQIPDDEPSFLDIIVSRENCDILFRIIDQLDDMYRIPILLRYYHQMRNTEIADLLHIEVNMVNCRLFRAKHMVIKHLKEMGYTHE